jgi:hypothetical protein
MCLSLVYGVDGNVDITGSRRLLSVCGIFQWLCGHLSIYH